MQISSTKLFVFVEGSQDVFFYSEICHQELNNRLLPYRVVQARELPGTSGGKRRLLNFFVYLRRKKMLISQFKGKRCGVVFYVDKDVDDIRRTRKRSVHLVYTKYYDVENHIFESADLILAAAAASSLSRDEVLRILGSSLSWRHATACRWREWVKLCIIAAVGKIQCESTYATKSRINANLYGEVEQSSLENATARIEQASRMKPSDFSLLYGKVSSIVDRLYRKGEQDKVFKGKWYSGFLAEDLQRVAFDRISNKNTLEDRVRSSVLASLDFAAGWAQYFRTPLRQVAERIR